MASLVFNVSGLLKEPTGSTREYDIDDEVPFEGGSRHVDGRVRMLRTRPGVLVSARLSGVEHGPCDRCLRDVAVPLELSFDEEFFASNDARTGAPLPQPEDSDAFRIEEHELVLDEAVRQWWTAGTPMQMLCRPDCSGLCGRCGKDLAEGQCGCQPETDERWAPLSELASKLKGN